METARNFFKSELRMSDDGWVFGGFPFLRFSSPIYEEGRRFKEAFWPGSFTKGLIGRNVRLFYEHEPSRELACVRDGSLKITEDRHFLKFRAKLRDDPFSVSVADSIAAGEAQISPGFRAVRDIWKQSNGDTLRIITEAKLIELSVVRRAQYGNLTCVSVHPPAQRSQQARPGVVFSEGLAVPYQIRETKTATAYPSPRRTI